MVELAHSFTNSSSCFKLAGTMADSQDTGVGSSEAEFELVQPATMPELIRLQLPDGAEADPFQPVSFKWDGYHGWVEFRNRPGDDGARIRAMVIQWDMPGYRVYYDQDWAPVTVADGDIQEAIKRSTAMFKAYVQTLDGDLTDFNLPDDAYNGMLFVDRYAPGENRANTLRSLGDFARQAVKVARLAESGDLHLEHAIRELLVAAIELRNRYTGSN